MINDADPGVDALRKLSDGRNRETSLREIVAADINDKYTSVSDRHAQLFRDTRTKFQGICLDAEIGPARLNESRPGTVLALLGDGATTIYLSSPRRYGLT